MNSHETSCKLKWIVLIFLLWSLAGTANAQFNVVSNFTLDSGGQSITFNNNSDVNTYLAQQTLAAAVRNVAVLGLNAVQVVNQRYFIPMQIFENQIPYAIRNSDSLAATVFANSLLDQWNRLQNDNDFNGTKGLKGVHVLLGAGGLGNVDAAFRAYMDKLGKSIQDAQGVPAQIEAYKKSNQGGLKFLESAWKFQGKSYANGMTCSDLVAHAAGDLGFSLPAYPWCKECKTLTGGWFRYGMGSQLPQIAGGDDGIPLRQLIDEYMTDKIKIPIGALIVADGHAALFTGVVKIGSQMEFITYDANASKGWSVSVLNGTATPGTSEPDDYGTIQLNFGGQQVGEHATRLQWKDSTPVKVFQFIGNPTLTIEDPWIRLQKARDTQCQQDIQIATLSRTTGCAAGKAQTECDKAKARYTQTVAGCSTPVYEGPLP